ncbi:MAG: hypothetical protein Ct9H300mP3_11230 [Gammaproteobacteria bacterium]|nr:MAG: hypothetical protein Ct9H300mP3_11230 [Gammaproteobacteria bacterium]
MSKDHPLVSEYRKFSPLSESLAKKAKDVFPGGDTRLVHTIVLIH